MGYNKRTKQGVKHKNTDGIKGEGNPAWKGDTVGRHSVHSWINDNFERPIKCEICKIDVVQGKKFDWSNKDHKYTRVREDWQYVCRKCHIHFDSIHNPRSYDKLNGRWSLYHEKCIECGKTDAPHKSSGKCRRCVNRLQYHQYKKNASV